MIPLNRKCFLTDMMCSYMRYALTDIFDCLIPNEDISTGEGLASQRRLKDLAERMGSGFSQEMNNPVDILRSILELKERDCITLGLEDFREEEAGYVNSINQELYGCCCYIHNLKDSFNKEHRALPILDLALKEIYDCRKGAYKGFSDGLEDSEYVVFQMLYAVELTTLLLLAVDNY